MLLRSKPWWRGYTNKTAVVTDTITESSPFLVETHYFFVLTSVRSEKDEQRHSIIKMPFGLLWKCSLKYKHELCLFHSKRVESLGNSWNILSYYFKALHAFKCVCIWGNALQIFTKWLIFKFSMWCFVLKGHCLPK